MHPVNQRWRDRRHSYRPAGETIRPAEYDVAPIDDDVTAKSFVIRHHYSGSFPAARLRYGLYRAGVLVGVAVYSHPVNNLVLTNVFPVNPTNSIELGRFVLLNQVPGNGETWFLARTFELLRRADIVGVVSFSDPLPRNTAAGRRIFPGHVGTIYQAHNAAYLGRGAAGRLRLLPDGSVLSKRTISKILSMDKGWKYGVQLLMRHGAPPPGNDLSQWMSTWLDRLTRSVRHPGNHKYAWWLHRSARRHVRRIRPYPKQIDPLPVAG